MQGIIFVLFALSLVEAFNLQPPSEAKLLGLPEKGDGRAHEAASQQPKPKRLKPKKPKRAPKKRGGYAGVTADDLDDEMELDDFELGSISRNGNGHPHANGALSPAEEEEDDDEEAPTRSRVRPPPPPSLLRVLRANVISFLSNPNPNLTSTLTPTLTPTLTLTPDQVIIFLYTLPINSFSIVLLYGVVTMALSEMINTQVSNPNPNPNPDPNPNLNPNPNPNPNPNNTQWDDLIALTLALVVVPGHMCWCMGNPRVNWEDRRLSRNGRLPLRRQLMQVVQLGILYFLLLLLLLVSMYSASATLQDYVSRRCFETTGKWLEEWID